MDIKYIQLFSHTSAIFRSYLCVNWRRLLDVNKFARMVFVWENQVHTRAQLE